MTVCNMSIEAGARAGMIAPDETTFAYLEGRPAAPRGADWERRSTRGARCAPTRTPSSTDVVEIDVSALTPQVTWGTNPGMVAPVDGRVPDPADVRRPGRARGGRARAPLHGPRAGHADPARSRIDRVFIGSCTNARIEDLRAAAAVVNGRHVAPTVRAMVVPGSATVKRQAEAEGLDRVFTSAGFEWRAGGLLDVPRHEPGHPRAGRALRLDVEPELRGPPGRGRPDAPRLARRWPRGRVAGHFTDVRELG